MPSRDKTAEILEQIKFFCDRSNKELMKAVTPDKLSQTWHKGASSALLSVREKCDELIKEGK